MRPTRGRLRFGAEGLRSACLIALAVAGAANLWAKPDPRAKGGFRLFARPVGAITINRVYCGIIATGHICIDSTLTFAGEGGGGFWPRGTVNQYVFDSGVQLAGVIGSDGGPWAGDTTAALFFDATGAQQASEVRPLYNVADPRDRADWPAAARVPCNQLITSTCTDPALGGAAQDASADIYSPVLQGRSSASQGDVWFLAWDGDPSRATGFRPHPLGVAVETRGLGWNYPKGNEDIIYFVTTFYNVSARSNGACGGCYDGVRPAMREILLEQAEDFHALNNAAFGVTLPEGGYTIDPLFAAYSADMDVPSFNRNYASVNLPFALGDSYNSLFEQRSGWTFDPGIFGDPFFKGTGFVGIKYLRSPTGRGEIHLFATPTNPGFESVPFGDPFGATQVFRYLSGNLDPLAGDDACNTGDPRQTHICYVWQGGPADIRFFQSSTPLSLAPGAFGSIVVAYIFAAPVAGICTPPSCNIIPGDVLAVTDPTRAGDPTQVPDQQKLAGYLGWSDVNANGVVEQEEFDVVPGSLLGKALTAQAVFDAKFLLPFSPDPPEFFMIPGHNQVTVMWRPSPSEMDGDPFFQIASPAQIGGVINPLYDPNFRQFDVEGYRVYRGRVNTPSDLTMIAQFDYAGTVIDDYGGQVDPSAVCAPELGLVVNCPAPYVLAEFQPGVQRTVSAAVQLNQSGSVLSQVRLGERVLLADGSALILVADTAVLGSTGSCAPNVCPPLQDNGVPFVFVDRNVRNNFRYFYAVTAFDFNSWQSGPTNLESARITKSVSPTVAATNYDNSATVTQGIYGRDVLLDHTRPAPTLDAATGKFSGPFPASNAWTIGLAGFVSEVLSGSGSLAVRLDSLRLGSPYNSPAVAHEYWYTGSAGGSAVLVMIPITQPTEIGLETGAALLPAVFIDGSLASRYGGDGTYSIPGAMGISMEGPDYHSLYGRGCVNGRDGFTNTVNSGECAYNGSRWFDGPSPATNEVMDNPIGANVANFSGNSMTANYSNAGKLTGVSLIHNTQAYQSVSGGEMRPMEGIKSGARRAADFNVHWGTGGTIDSVIDITHNVAVPFAADHLGGTWGILNPSESATDPAGSYDGRPELTNTDFHCVPPVNDVTTHDPGDAECQGAVFTLSRTAVPGPIVPFSQGLAAAQTDPVFADAGFGLYLSGDIFTIGLAGGTLPSDGTVWSLRTYIGAISGGVGAGGDYGPYSFNVFPAGTVVPRSWTAVGTELRVSFDVVNQVNAPTANDIANVHPVPDPYYITNDFEVSTSDNRIEFINLPAKAIIRIYSSSGVLVDLLEHNSTQAGGSISWSVRNRNNQAVASGVYFFHVEANDQRKVGRMTIVRFAE